MADTGFNEEVFNMEVRKFLKRVGVTSQREIERAVREALGSGRLKGTERLRVEMTLSLPEAGLTHRVEDEIRLSQS
ncbi:MAG TPA: DUF6494 family protein [Burkholderiales bacterium]